MKQKKQRNIKQKVVRLVLMVSVVGILAVSIITIFSMNSMKDNTVEMNSTLGNLAADDAKTALSNQAKQNISDLARSKADYIEQSFGIIETYVNQIADETTRIYDNPEDYPERVVDEPKKENGGIVATQLMYSSIVSDKGDVSSELAKISNVKDTLYQVVKQDSVVASAYIATKSGTVIMADSSSQKKFEEDSDVPSPYEAFVRPCYIKAEEENKLIFTDVINDVHGGGLGIICAKPFYKEDEFMGVAGVGSFLDDINNLVMETEIGESGYAFLVNQNGQINISPKTEGEVAADPDNLVDLRLSDNKMLAATVEKMTSGKSGISELTIDGDQVYLAYEPMKTLGWSFAVLISVDEVLAPANKSNESIIAMTKSSSDSIDENIGSVLFVLMTLAIVVLGVSVVVSIRWSDSLTLPIKKLVDEVHKVGDGNLDTEIILKTGNEVEELADSFNKTTDGKFVYVNAGHNAPLIKRANGNFEWIKAKHGFVLAGIEGMKYKQAELTLERGDVFSHIQMALQRL